MLLLHQQKSIFVPVIGLVISGQWAVDSGQCSVTVSNSDVDKVIGYRLLVNSGRVVRQAELVEAKSQ